MRQSKSSSSPINKHLLSCWINISVFSVTELQNWKENSSSEYAILAVAEGRRQTWIQIFQLMYFVPQKKEMLSSSYSLREKERKKMKEEFH